MRGTRICLNLFSCLKIWLSFSSCLKSCLSFSCCLKNCLNKNVTWARMHFFFSADLYSYVSRAVEWYVSVTKSVFITVFYCVKQLFRMSLLLSHTTGSPMDHCVLEYHDLVRYKRPILRILKVGVVLKSTVQVVFPNC